MKKIEEFKRKKEILDKCNYINISEDEIKEARRII